MRPGPARNRLADERGLIGKALVVSLAMIAVFGLAVVEGGSVLFAHLQMQEIADQAANDAEASYSSSHNMTAAQTVAADDVRARDPSAHLTRFLVGTDGTVTVSVTKIAPTILLRRVSFLERYAVVTATSIDHPNSNP